MAMIKPILQEIKAAVKSVEGKKYIEDDSIPVELLNCGGLAMLGFFRTIHNKIWLTNEWSTPFIHNVSHEIQSLPMLELVILR